ncbi:MAG TPA: SdrD B-like domain-containing protein [Ferruginibacter sp.]|nr:SdrD B-like domain-containing protein [Ferruginibacter sp.]
MRISPVFFTLYLFIPALFFWSTTSAQSFIQFSHYNGGSLSEGSGSNAFSPPQMAVENGFSYMAGMTTSSDIAVTDGSTFKGGIDLIITRYDSSGNILYSKYLGSWGYDELVEMKVINNEVYLTVNTNGTGFPVTNGSSFHGTAPPGLDVVVLKIDAAGNIVFCTYLGGITTDMALKGMQLINNNSLLLITGMTYSADFPVDPGETSRRGTGADGFITSLNTADGSIVHSRVFGGTRSENLLSPLYDNGFLYAFGTTNSTDLPLTTGQAPKADSVRTDCFVYKFNALDLTTTYCVYLGGTLSEFPSKGAVANGNLYLAGTTNSVDYPVNNNSVAVTAGAIDHADGFYTRVNSDGSINFSTYLTTNTDNEPIKIAIDGTDVFLACYSSYANNLADDPLVIYKFSNSNALQWTAQLPVGFLGWLQDMIVSNGEIHLTGNTQSSSFPITNNTHYYNSLTGFYAKLNTTGDIIFATFLGTARPRITKILNGRINILGTDYRGTGTGADDNILIVLDPDGSIFYSGYLGGSSSESPFNLHIDNSGAFISGITSSNNYPVTDTAVYGGMNDFFISKLSFCPSVGDVTKDTLFPRTQTVCKNGQVKEIAGVMIKTDTSLLPLVYRNGIAAGQSAFTAVYQWQRASSPGGPWTEIPESNSKDYTPSAGGINQYYRRLALAPAACGGWLLHISDTAEVLVNNFTAPAVDAGGNYATCPGSAVTLGGTPSATGGNPPYNYQWDQGAGNNSNPVVSPNSNTIYTVTVTDAQGCRQVKQAVVYVFKADAGADISVCEGSAAAIGGLPVTGAPGSSYSWQPASGLTSATAAQPFVNINTLTNYIVTLTIVKNGGGTCTSTDTVKVTPVAAPLTPGFAGTDKVICIGDTAYLGTPPEPGFLYYWSPSFYITSNTTSTTKFFGGNLVMPDPNPITMQLSAQKNGCVFSDAVQVSTIESKAGVDKCGTSTLGSIDRTPNINETYLWSLLSGPGNFTGPTNQAMTTVSASAESNSVYGLTVSYNGHSCYDEVTVKPICTPTACKGIFVDAKYHCPSYGVNGGDVTMTVLHDIPGGVTYQWSPQEGLSGYNSQTVRLTDNISRTYTVFITSVTDPSVVQFGGIEVNNPAASVPVFIAPDTVAICRNVPTTIGMLPITGNYYDWTGNGLSDHHVSNPVVTSSMGGQYRVRVYDITGCEIMDTVNVAVDHSTAYAGPDWIICTNGIARLGSAALPNTSYVWEPQLAPWQNGTNQFSAQPEVLVATNLTFAVTATTTTGCITTDTVKITVNNTPAINLSSSTAFVCKGNKAYIGTSPLPGVTYSWSPADSLTNPFNASTFAGPSETTTYTLTATFPGNCPGPAIGQVLVTVSDASFSLPDLHYCPGNGAISLGANVPQDMRSYYWTPSGILNDNNTANPTTFNPPPGDTTVFNIFVVNNSGCYANNQLTIIPEVVSPEAGSNRSVCLNNSTVIGSNLNNTGPGISYSWSPSINLSNASSPAPVFTSTNPGNMILRLTKNMNGCTTTDSITITVKDSLLTGLNAPVVCENSCVQTGISPAPGISYQWTPATGLSNANIANPVVCAGTNTAVYTLKADDNTGCVNTTSVVIAVNPVPAPVAGIPDVFACLGDSGIYFNPSITANAPYKYKWRPDDGSLSNTAILNPRITVTSPGMKRYFLNITDSITGCSNTVSASLFANTCNRFAGIGDYLWFDLDGNGRQGTQEPGVSGMQIRLYNSSGINIASTGTDANGMYSFNNIPPGNGYYVRFSKPAGYVFTPQNMGGANLSDNSKADTSGQSVSFNLTAGNIITTIDAGIQPAGTTPVLLVSFTAAMQANNTVTLNWQTSAEYNNAYFEVQRSDDGIRFLPISRIDGFGTSSLPHSYSLIDKDPLPGIVYYRLKQVDKDGHFIYSIIAVVKNKTLPSITVVYNAGTNSLHIQFAEKQNKAVIRLLGYNGQLIKLSSISNANSCLLQLPAVADGVYILQVMNEKLNYTEKLLIRR